VCAGEWKEIALYKLNADEIHSSSDESCLLDHCAGRNATSLVYKATPNRYGSVKRQTKINRTKTAYCINEEISASFGDKKSQFAQDGCPVGVVETLNRASDVPDHVVEGSIL